MPTQPFNSIVIPSPLTSATVSQLQRNVQATLQSQSAVLAGIPQDGSSATCPFGNLASQVFKTSADLSVTVQVVVLADTTEQQVIVRLPLPSIGRALVIKDAGGNAGLSPVNVVPTGTALLDGGSLLLVNTAYGSLRVISDGTDWWSW